MNGQLLNLLVKSISNKLTRVYGAHSELLIRPTKLVKSVGRCWLVKQDDIF